MGVFKGEQYHHNNPSELTGQLYLAAARAISGRVLLDLGITCIINATLELPTIAYHNQDCLQIAVEDRVASKLYVYFDLVADKINAVHNSKGKAMIYCRAGMSRSASLCIAYFIKYHGMTLEDAFSYVKQRRPIIHPNVGFMRQLKEYERKVRSRDQEQTSKSMIPGIELPKLMFAECCWSRESDSVFEYDDYDKVKIIKPRPTPRQPKVLFVEDVVDVTAQKYQITVVELCAPAESTCMNERNISENAQHSDCQSAMTSDIVLPPAHSAAENICPDCREHLGLFKALYKDEQAKRTAFSKICEPARHAVSYEILDMDMTSDLLVRDDSNEIVITNQIAFAYFSVIAELLPVPEVVEEVSAECVSQGKDSTAVSQGDLNEDNVVTTIHSNLVGNATCLWIQLLEAPEMLTIQPIKPESLLRATPPSLPKVPNTKPKLKRTNSSRTSMKLSGLKLTGNLERIKKPMQETLASYLSVLEQFDVTEAICDTISTEIPSLSYEKHHLQLTLEEPLTSAEIMDCDTELFELAIRDLHSSPQIISSDYVSAKQTLFAQSCITVEMQDEVEIEDLLPIESGFLPSREYPYYSLIKRNPDPIQFYLSKASESPPIEVCYFFTLAPRKSTKTVCMVPRKDVWTRNKKNKEESEKPVKKRYIEPALHWASERYDIDINASYRTCKQMQDLEIAQATPGYAGIKSCRAFETLDESLFIMVAPAWRPKVKAQNYSPWSITNMCNYPLFSVISQIQWEPLELTNMFCEPTEFACHCKEDITLGSEESLYVADQLDVHVQHDAMDLAEIPDAIHDINELKRQIMRQTDPVKVAIWLDIFKRSVIKARPIFPFVRLSELHLIAESFEISEQEWFEDNTDISVQDVSYEQAHLGMEIKLPSYLTQQDCFELPGELNLPTFKEIMKECDPKIETSVSTSVHEIHYQFHLENTSPICSSTLLDLPTQPSVSMEDPFQAALVQETTIEAVGMSLSDESAINTLERWPFKVIYSWLGPATQLELVSLISLENEFQSEEISPMEGRSVNHAAPMETLDKVSEVFDIFWYFEKGSSNTDKKLKRDDKRGNYKLFLPDPEAAEKVCSEIVTPPTDAQKSLQTPLPTSRQTHHSNEQPRRLARQVSFIESPLRSRPGDYPRLSKYKNSSTEEPKELSDRRIYANLTASVRHSSNVLESHKRARSTCRPEGDQKKASGAKISDSKSEKDGVTLKGLLDVAQTWIGDSRNSASKSPSRSTVAKKKTTSSRTRSRSGRRRLF